MIQVDVIVSTISGILDMSHGILARKILQQAGQSVQRECRSKAPNGLAVGEIVSTGGGNLQTSAILHTVCAKYGEINAPQVCKSSC